MARALLGAHRGSLNFGHHQQVRIRATADCQKAVTARPKAAHMTVARGRGWQRGHEYDDRFMNGSLRTGRPHRGHGRPSCPYTASDRSK